MREKLFLALADFIHRRYIAILIVALIVTAAAFHSASKLRIKTQFKDMLPQGTVMVQEFNKILDDYEAASSVIVGVEGDDPDRMKAYVQAAVPRLEAYTDYVRRVDWRNEMEFLKAHGLMLLKEKDLDNAVSIFGDLRLPALLKGFNDNFEKDYIDDQENLNTLEGERNAIQFLDALDNWIDTIADYALGAGGPETSWPGRIEEAAEQLVLGQELLISSDKTLLMFSIQPRISIDDYEGTLLHLKEVRRILREVQADYPGIQVNFAGVGPLTLEENEALQTDMKVSTYTALILILLLLGISFRMWTMPLLAMITLVSAIGWTGGLLRFIFPDLDMFAVFFGVILLGLGIDYAIHLNEGFAEARSAGLDLRDALRQMYLKVGNGVVTGALTTALVFFTLILTRLRPIVQMGVTIGAGILLCLVAMFVVQSSLIVLHYKVSERLGTSRVGKVRKPSRFRTTPLERCGHAIVRFPVPALLLSLAATAVLAFFALRIEFDYDMLAMEPEDMPSVILQNKIIDKFNISPDYALLAARSVDEARTLTERFKKKRLVGMVDSISEFLPDAEEQVRLRGPKIERFRAALEAAPAPGPWTEADEGRFFRELKRLSDNIVEIGILANIGNQRRIENKCTQITGADDASNKILIMLAMLRKASGIGSRLSAFETLYVPSLRRILTGMCSTEVVTLEGLPERIVKRYANRDASRFLITVYPKGNVWDGLRLKSFCSQMLKVSELSTGSPLVFNSLIDLMTEKATQATLFAGAAILFLLLADFRRIGMTVLTILPLFFGAFWMVGGMVLLGMKFNFSNIMTVPLILGIGIDDGVHVTHRYIREGRGLIPKVLRHTGRAIFLTSATTILAFGSMGLASHRGLASMGHSLVIGVSACFVTSVFSLPSILVLIERVRDRWKGGGGRSE